MLHRALQYSICRLNILDLSQEKSPENIKIILKPNPEHEKYLPRYQIWPAMHHARAAHISLAVSAEIS